MPDFLQGEYADHSWFPTDTDEKKAKLGAFFGGAGAPPKTVARVPATLDALNAAAGGSITQWGIVGYCWGGKIVSLTVAQDGTPFKAAAECHPGMVDPADAKAIKIPIALLASGDEPEDAVKQFGEALTGPQHVETFKDQVHGWMAARGDLADPHARQGYERGYKVLLDWL